MSSLLARIMLAIFMLPSTAMVGMVSAVVLYELRIFGYPYRNRATWICATIITWSFVGAYWILLWRKSVQWTPERRRMTGLAVGLAAIIGGIVGFATRIVDDDFGFFVFASVTILAWLPLTVFIWRENVAERAARMDGAESALTCPTCGYNLTGLNTARCPECGSTFTLDELVRRQPGRERVEIS